MINPTDYCNGTAGLWDDYNTQDHHTLSLPLYGVTTGNSQQVREEFNRRFNFCIQYHANLWRDVATELRSAEYYADRYATLYEDLFRLCEKFPDIPELNNEYWNFIRLFKHYSKLAEDFRNRIIEQQRKQLEESLQELRAMQRAHKEKYPNGEPPTTCPRCNRKSYYRIRLGLQWDEYECKVCGYPSR